MDCEEAKLKVQALADNELDEAEIPAVLHHLESCYRCRNEYIEFLSLQKELRGAKFPEPEQAWFEERYRRKSRKFGSSFGQIFFIVSYIALIIFAVFQLFKDPDVSMLLRVIIGGIIIGVAVLFAVTVGDRIREKKTDRYGDVQK